MDGATFTKRPDQHCLANTRPFRLTANDLAMEVLSETVADGCLRTVFMCDTERRRWKTLSIPPSPLAMAQLFGETSDGQIVSRQAIRTLCNGNNIGFRINRDSCYNMFAFKRSRNLEREKELCTRHSRFANDFHASGPRY